MAQIVIRLSVPGLDHERPEAKAVVNDMSETLLKLLKAMPCDRFLSDEEEENRGYQSAHVMDDAADCYILDGADWAERYDGDDDYERLSDEERADFVRRLQDSIPMMADAIFCDETYRHGESVLSEIVTKRKAKEREATRQILP